MKVRWTQPALDRLKAQRAWLESLENANSRKVIAAIRGAVGLLERLGDIGRPSRVAGHRELSVRHHPYVIIYRIENDICIVAAVFHTAEDRN